MSDSGRIEYFLEMLSAERGAANNTLDSYARDLSFYSAHMEKDVNTIIDVDSSEAGLLIELIETLLEDWYVERHKRQERNDRLKALGETKLNEKKAAAKAAKEKQNP